MARPTVSPAAPKRATESTTVAAPGKDDGVAPPDLLGEDPNATPEDSSSAPGGKKAFADKFKFARNSDDAEKEDADQEASPSKRPSARVNRRLWPLYVALSLFAVLVLIAGVFSWDRWMRYDDANEIKGEWLLDGTQKVIVIDGQAIKLTDDVSYEYTIDPTAKTITYTFGNMSGSGRYRFSADRSQLAIVDGESFSTFSTMCDDIAWTWGNFVRGAQGQEPVAPGEGDGATVLERLSHNSGALPRNLNAAADPDADKQKADKAAAGEEEPAPEDAASEDPAAGEEAANAASPNAEQGAGGATNDAANAGGSTTGGASTGGSNAGGSNGGSNSSPSRLFNVEDVSG